MVIILKLGKYSGFFSPSSRECAIMELIVTPTNKIKNLFNKQKWSKSKCPKRGFLQQKGSPEVKMCFFCVFFPKLPTRFVRGICNEKEAQIIVFIV